ncbi:MAG: endonuclease MutS2 [Paludibacteraceae bacterium]|nr:endonuclease MutS2 [Paludibacteraceae bacterium]
MLYPDNIETKLGFTTIREHISDCCTSAPSIAVAMSGLTYTADREMAGERLSKVWEMMVLTRETGDAIPLGEIRDLRETFATTRAEGTFLDLQEVEYLRKNLLVLQSLIMYLKSLDAERFPLLRQIVEGRETFKEVIRRVDCILDKYGDVRDTASDTLHAIRKQMREAQGSVARTLNSILKEAKARGAIDPDVSPTMREGRLMLPVPSANKRMVNGIVHDESSTGKTSFIEPAAVVEINNRLRELEGEERREIVRILIELTDWLRPMYDGITDAMTFIMQVDALHAVAKYSIRIKAVVPQITKSSVEIYSARHPLLEASLQSQGREIVPLDIKLSKKQRIIVISGPNAGGKSVCLKTLGLLQYMLGCGLPIPVAERSSTMLFSSIFVDIGDEQSLENDLSTYSSHLYNMKSFMKSGDGRSLMLIDELGSGTEPLIGGAIAEAVLGRLNEKSVYGVITTHYSNLKTFATESDGMVNGAMLYDRHNMQPLFTLSIGMAGSSFAIDIARKIGLPSEVIKRATELVGEEQVDFDKYLQDVARDKRYWEKKREQIREQERRLRQLTEEYENKMAGVKAEEKKIIAEARDEATQIISGANAEIEKTIRTIKEAGAEKMATREARRALKEKEESMKAKPQVVVREQVFKVGDRVMIEGQNVPGKVVDVQGRQAVVLFGQVKTTVAMSRLHATNVKDEKPIRQQSNIVDVIHEKQSGFSQQIDIRGMRVDEALDAVVAFIDDASMLHTRQVRILHGTGTGALRQAVRQYLSTCSSVEAFHDEHVQFGGAGITIVEIAE